MTDDDETLEVVTFGSGEIQIIHYGLQMRMMRARGAYLAGHLSADQFETEVERIVAREWELTHPSGGS